MDKRAPNYFGRPKFVYHVSSRTTKQVSVTLQDLHVELVALSFSRLRHVCRFEKGGPLERKQGKIANLKIALKHEIKNYSAP